MSEIGNGGNGNAGDEQLVRRKDLVDVVELTFDRADGSLQVGGKVVNLDVAMDMCQRAARYFETQLRIAVARQVQQNAAEAQRVAAMLEHARGRSQ